MVEVLFQIALIVLLMVGNGLFAMSEIAIVSARRVRLLKRAQSGERGAREALELAATPTEFLFSVQIGITLVGILAGAYGGATISGKLAVLLEPLPIIGAHAHTVAFTVVVLFISYLSLVIGELVPKRLALSAPETVAVWVARPMRFLCRMAAPAVRILTLSTDALMRALPLEPVKELGVTEEEVRILIEHGARTGAFDAGERRLIENVFHLGDRRVGTVMTPRDDVIWLDVEDPPEVITQVLAANRFSRYPVGAGSLDKTIGVVRAKDMLPPLLRGEKLDLRKLAIPPVVVPEGCSALALLETFRNGTNLAVVAAEHGAVQGVVTASDILGSLAQELRDTEDGAGENVAPQPGGGWVMDGRLPMHEFVSIAHVNGPAGEHPETLGGFVMARLERMPRVGDRVAWQGLELEVIDMAGLRVETVRVHRV